LEELVEADLLVHVVDITHHNATEQHSTVENIINELNLSSKPRITVLNKVDIAVEKLEDLDSLVSNLGIPDTAMVTVSALRGWGLDKLTAKISEFLGQNSSGYANAHNKQSHV
jgi:GTP-binding protein HflX